MGFNLLAWKQSGRAWGRGSPPPRGSIEYVAVGDMWEEGPSRTISGSVWVISAFELDAAKRWCETLARSVDYARRVHGDGVLSPADAEKFTRFYRAWLSFSDRVGTWSLVERAKESNKRQFEELLVASKKLHDEFAKKGMALMPVPHVADLVLMLRGMPRALDAGQMAAKLMTAASWGRDMSRASETTAEWVQRSGIMAASLLTLGPAGYLFAKMRPTSWSADRAPLEAAVARAAEMAKYLQGEKGTFGRGEPVYDEFMRAATKIYVEAAGLYGIRESERSTTARLADDLSRGGEREGKKWLLILGVAGVGYLGVRWLASHPYDRPSVRVPDAVPGGEP